MNSDSWQLERETLQTRIFELQKQLESSVRRQEQATKLNNRLLEALNQISQEEDIHKQFVEEIEKLVMLRTNNALNNISSIYHKSTVRNPNSTFEASYRVPHDEDETSRRKPERPEFKENRNSMNSRPIGLDKQQIKSMTAKLIRVRKNESYDLK